MLKGIIKYHDKNKTTKQSEHTDKKMHRLFQKVGNSIDIDRLKEDIQGSIAHVEMLLNKNNFIQNKNKIVYGLTKIDKEQTINLSLIKNMKIFI